MNHSHTLAVLPTTIGISDVLRVNERLVTLPDELLRSDLLLAIVLRAPAQRKSPAHQASPASSFDRVRRHILGDIVFPGFSCTDTAARGVPLRRNDLCAVRVETRIRDPSVGFVGNALS